MPFVIRKLNSARTLGEEIRELRRATGFTLSEMEARTKVRRCFLEAFEAGRFCDLPDTLYARNYLKTYLKTLGLDDINYYLKRWEEERGTCDFVDASRLPRQRVRAIAFLVASRFVKIAGVAAVIIAVSSYIGSEVRSVMAAPELTVYGPLDGVATQDASVVVSGATEPGTDVTVNGQEVLLNSDGTFEMEVALERGINVITVEGAKRYSQTSTEYRRVVLEATKTTAAADQELIP
jgi:hypothetical protein